MGRLGGGRFYSRGSAAIALAPRRNGSLRFGETIRGEKARCECMPESEDLSCICGTVEDDEDFTYPIREPQPLKNMPVLEWAELVIG